MDPKPEPRRGNAPIREVDPAVSRRFHLRGPACLVCGSVPVNAAHVVPRGAPWFGDDVDVNLVPLCGSGSHGCHGAAHGNPYTRTGAIVTPKVVREAVGRFLGSEEGAGHLAYVTRKLGAGPGRAFLERVYYLEVE